MPVRLWPLLFRLVSTLVVAPPLFLAVVLYIRVQTAGGGSFWPAAAKELGQLYLDVSLPALALILILAPLDYVLQRVDFGLTTIVISPLVAGLIVFGLGDVFNEPHVRKAAAMLPLFVVYGLVWGLTIRDPAVWRRGTASA